MPMKFYDITFEKDFKVSVVKNPALELTMVKFKEETETPLYFTNEEKREIFSVAMSPDKWIYRNNINGQPGYVKYTPETVEKFQQNYFKTNANSGTNIDHAEFNTDGVFPFESWIVANPNNDKSNELGLTTKKGDLVMGFKVENDTVWQQCKEGNLDGLSIEGKVLFREVNQTNINMKLEKNPQNLWDTLKAFFSTEVEPVEMALDPMIEACNKCIETCTSVIADNVSPEVTKACEDCKAACEAMVAEQNTENIAKCVSYCKKCVEVLNTVDNESAKACQTACNDCLTIMGETPEENTAEAATENEPIAQEAAEVTVAPEVDWEAKVLALEEENAKLKADLATIEAEKIKAEADLVTMSLETPAAAAIVDLPIETKKEYAQMSNFEKLKFNKENKK